ncbi:MAG: hypothetical protein AB1560_04305 [Pseudomonadota bacterium]
MNKKPTPRKKSKTPTSAKLTAKDIQRQLKRLEEQVYYVVYERPFRGVDTRFFLDVSESTFRLSAWPCATLFKKERLARFVAREYSALRQRRLYVAPVTIRVSGNPGGGRN